MFRLSMKRRSRGFTLVEVLAVSAIMSSMQSQGGFYYAINRTNEVKGTSNLKQIHALLQMESMAGGLPRAAFYPQGDPRTDPKSLVKLLNAPADLFVSPFAPEALKKKGLTFAWNDTVNGRELDNLPKDTWLMVDLAAFIADEGVPKPHRYLILYADGRAVSTSDLPPDIAKVVAEAKAKKAAEGK